MEQQPKLTENREIIAFLAEKFPACFVIEGDAKPLKIGIFQDLVQRLTAEDRVSNTRLRQAIRHYTSSLRYLSAVKADAYRVDLDGESGEQVTTEHEQYAQERLTEIKARIEERKAKAKKQREQKREQQAKKARPPRRNVKSKNQSDKPKAQKSKPVDYKPVKAEELKEGVAVQILVGTNPVSATIEEVMKGSVRVTLASGMAIEVANERVVSA